MKPYARCCPSSRVIARSPTLSSGCHPRATVNTVPNRSPAAKPVRGAGADDRTRTGDLVLTKDALYLLSYIGPPSRSPASRSSPPPHIPRATPAGEGWSGRRGSNPRPTAWKAVTLPLSYSRLRVHRRPTHSGRAARGAGPTAFDRRRIHLAPLLRCRRLPVCSLVAPLALAERGVDHDGSRRNAGLSPRTANEATSHTDERRRPSLAGGRCACNPAPMGLDISACQEHVLHTRRCHPAQMSSPRQPRLVHIAPPVRLRNTRLAGRRLVARGGFEPPKPLGRQIYSLLRLTAPQPRRCWWPVSEGRRHAAADVSRQGQRSACRSAGSHTAGLLPPRAFGGRAQHRSRRPRCVAVLATRTTRPSTARWNYSRRDVSTPPSCRHRVPRTPDRGPFGTTPGTSINSSYSGHSVAPPDGARSTTGPRG